VDQDMQQTGKAGVIGHGINYRNYRCYGIIAAPDTS
jgi:hypothetical protein